MKNLHLINVLFVFLVANSAFARSPSFHKLVCHNVMGSNLNVTSTPSQVVVVLSNQDGTLVDNLSFHTNSCAFSGGFSIDLVCENADQKVQISRTQKLSREGSIYSDVSLVTASQASGVEHNETFSTRKVQSGKVASCTINEAFEVK